MDLPQTVIQVYQIQPRNATWVRVFLFGSRNREPRMTIQAGNPEPGELSHHQNSKTRWVYQCASSIPSRTSCLEITELLLWA